MTTPSPAPSGRALSYAMAVSVNLGTGGAIAGRRLNSEGFAKAHGRLGRFAAGAPQDELLRGRGRARARGARLGIALQGYPA